MAKKHNSTKRLNIKCGDKFSRLTVIQEVAPHRYPSGSPRRKFRCICDCGNIKDVLINELVSGGTKSCGCLQIEKVSNLSKTHGLSKHPLYVIYCAMKKRCYNKNDPKYDNYGGKGVKICDEWLNDFKVFFDWATQNGWKKGLHIDRINTEGDYSEVNCRIVTAKENSRNRTLHQKNNKSGYKGVYFHGRAKRWFAEIGYNWKRYHMGPFDTPEEAAKAYDEKAKSFNSTYTLNFPEESLYVV